ncbi:MAG TPA: sialidase family protein [Acidimicrobiales bacterium]|nr:sialidase family protein [Acidimicrobiales bacterium]
MSRRTRRLAVVAVGLTVLAGSAASAATPTLTTPIHITKDDLNPGRTYSSPNFAVDPSNPEVIVGAFAELRTRRCGLIRTTNGGETWTVLDPAQSSPSPSSYPNCNSNPRGTFQAQPAFGRDGNLYMALNGWDTQDGGVGGNPSIIVSKSPNLGDTWTPMVARDNRGKTGEAQEADRPVTGIAVDRKTGNADTVYVGASRRSPGFSGANALPNQPIVIVSTDGGKTFTEPINLAASAFADAGARQKAFSSATTVPNSTTTTAAPGTRAATPDQAANFGGFGPSMTVDDKGTVYAVWPATYANLNPRPAGAIFVSKSTDKGKTWTTSPVTAHDFKIGSFVTVVWSPKGGPQGTLHAVSDGYENPSIAGYTDIYYYRSTDGGATWTERKNVTDDDPKQVYGQVYPNIAVAPDGRVDIAFFDTRNDPGTRSNDVYYTSSSDNGTTWSANMRITDRSIDRKIGVFANNADVNAPPGLAATKAFTLIGWDDTRNGDAVGQAQDLYSSAVQYSAVGGGTSSAAKVALAGVVGLLIVGLALLAVSMISKRNRQEPSSAGEVQTKAKAKV